MSRYKITTFVYTFFSPHKVTLNSVRVMTPKNLRVIPHNPTQFFRVRKTETTSLTLRFLGVDSQIFGSHDSPEVGSQGFLGGGFDSQIFGSKAICFYLFVLRSHVNSAFEGYRSQVQTAAEVLLGSG